MNITDIDAVSVAAAAGHQAAARLLAILTEDEAELVHGWFMPAGAMATGPSIEDGLQIFAHFIVAHDIQSGEPVWLQAREQRVLMVKADRFSELPYAVRVSFDLFARTVLRVHQVLSAEQEAETRRTTPPAKLPGLKKEDSIFAEDGDDIGTKVEWADEFEKRQAEIAKAQSASPKKGRIHGGGAGDAGKARNGGMKNEPALSAGERLTGAPTPNAGGRPATNRRAVKRATRKAAAKSPQ